MKKLEKSEVELHEKFVLYGANAKLWMRKCVLLLPEIGKQEIWKKKGFGSIYEYAAKLAGMSKNTVDDALRVLGKIEDKPNLRMVAEAKGIEAVRPVVTIATAGNEKFWARKAAAMSKSTLETYVREYKKQEEGRIIGERLEGRRSGATLDALGENSADRARPGTETVTVSMELDKEVAEALQKLKGQGDWNALMKEFLELRQEKLEAERPEPVVNAKRYIPARIRKHVLKKTNEQCAYPGCSKPYAIFHHTRRWALWQAHDPQTLAPLCKGHERLAHHGLVEHEQKEVRQWRLRAEVDRENPAYAVDRRVMRYRKA